MMQDVMRLVLAVSDSLELSIIAKATVVVGLALVAGRTVRHARASVRYIVLASAFGVLVVLPAIVRLMPPLAVSVSLPADADPLPARPFVGEVGEVNHRPSGVSGVSRAPAGWSPDRIATLLRYAWTAVAAMFLVPVAVVLWRLHRLRRGGLPWMRGEPLVRTLAAESGIGRSIDILR